jgi:hypothetical protein
VARAKPLDLAQLAAGLIGQLGHTPGTNGGRLPAGLSNAHRPERFATARTGRAVPLRRATWLLAAIVLTAGCAVQRDRETPQPPQPQVSAATWEGVRREVVLASLVGRGDATGYARQAVVEWLERVRQYSETAFIPWYTSYWTQEWLAIKLALHGPEDDATGEAAVQHLARHLEQEFAARVLEPASEDSGPAEISRRATAIYLSGLQTAISTSGKRHRIPEAALRSWLTAVPALTAAGADSQSIPLSELLGTGPDHRLESRIALLEQIEAHGLSSQQRLAQEALAKEASALAAAVTERFAARSGAAAATVMGGPVGAVISLGLTGWSLSQHEQLRPELEARVREQLLAIRAGMYRELLDDPENGVLGAVNQIHARIAAALRGAPTETPSPPLKTPW